jgi:hypothetical protein
MNRLGDLTKVINENPHWAALEKYNHIRVEFPDGTERSLLLTDREVQVGLTRADKNQSDFPKIGWIRNLFD